MRKIASVFVLAVCAGALFTLSSCGQSTPPAGAAERKDAAADSAQPEPEDLLRHMANYLADLPAFACRVTSTVEIKAQGVDNRMETKIAVRLERPNRLSLVVEQGVMGMTVVSDGKQVFRYLPMLNQYVVEEAPADFAGLSDASTSMMPLGISPAAIPARGDEFYDALMNGVTKSEYLGTEKIGDVLCHHCRFLQEVFNWDIWIEAGDRPLVHKVLPDLSKQMAGASGTLEGAKLEYSVTFSEWDVAPKFTAADFAFNPPAGAAKVEAFFGNEEEAPHPLVGQPAPVFETVDPQGNAIDLKQHVGKNMILLDFWATWCGPCVRAMPDVDAVAEKYADQGLVFYAVNLGEDAATVKEFLTENKLDVPVAMDPDGNIGGLYQVEGIPQSVLVGKDGKVQVVHVGFSSALGKELVKNIEDLLAGEDLAAETLGETKDTSEKSAAEPAQ